MAEPKKRPNPNPMRLFFGVTGLATLSALVTSIVSPIPGGAATEGGTATADTAAVGPDPAPVTMAVQHITRYVQLKPGESAPAGATVIGKAAPQPKIVVTTVTVPAPARAQSATVVTKTKQSGG